MKRLLTSEFWKTPILEIGGSDKRHGMLLFLVIVLICIAVAGVAAAHLLNL